MASATPYCPKLNHKVFLVGLITILILGYFPAFSQNTKGDRTQPGGTPKRESRFKSTKKKKLFSRKESYNRVQPRGSTRASRAQSSRQQKVYPQKGKFVNNASRTAKDSKQNTRSTSRLTTRSVSSQTRNVYPQRGPYVNNPSRTPSDKPRFTGSYSKSYKRVSASQKDPQQRWRAVSAKRVTVRSATGSIKNVYPQRGKFVNNPSRTPGHDERSVFNQSQAARMRLSAAQPPGKRKRTAASSASRQFISHKSINPFAGFWNKKPKGEKPYTRGDLAGHKLRGKNFQTRMPVLINPTANPYRPKKWVGDKPYKGPSGGFISATQSGRAWRGDIAGRKIRGRNFSSKKNIEGQGQPIFPPPRKKIKVGDTPYRGKMGGYQSATGPGKKFISPIPSKVPGAVADRIDGYSGNLRRTGKGFSTMGADYSGSIKARKPLKGGGSVSGRVWNNRQQPIQGKMPKGGWGVGSYQGNIKFVKKEPNKEIGGFRGTQRFARTSIQNQGEVYTGHMKASRPLTGGRSISGRVWNNREQPIQGKMPKGGLGVGSYQGNIKFVKKEPSKDVGGFPGKHKLFDLRPSLRNQGEEFTGFAKAKKPVKGGGSISGKLWNNNEKPIQVKMPKSGWGIGSYQGNIKVSKKEPSKEVGGFPGKFRDTKPTMVNQGEEFTGFIKLPRFRKQYIENPNSSEDALRKSRPDKNAYRVNELWARVKQQEYKTKPHAAEGALRGIAVSKSSIKASEYSKVLRMIYGYERNPNSAKEALKTREPGKAFGKSTDYQGNIKMKKFDLFGKRELHPDAQFVKTNKNNVDGERGMLTNIKLLWAKLFGKNDTQPSNIKEKQRKPRYDKGEAGLWYNQHNSSGGANSRKSEKAEEN